jgi:hypothetical protein
MIDPSAIDQAVKALYPTMAGTEKQEAPPAAAAAAAPPAAPPAAAAPAAAAPAAATNDSARAGGQAELDVHPDAEMQALREDTTYSLYRRPEAERAIPEGVLDALVGKSIEVDGQAVEMTQQLARKGVTELRAMAADLSLSATEVAAVENNMAFAQSIRGDEQKTIAAREAAVQMLNEEHGNQASLAAQAARAYVAKNPKLAQVLDQSGAGDVPDVIALVARRALALHKAGKLTIPRQAEARKSNADVFYGGR